MGKIDIIHGIYVFDWRKAYNRFDFYLEMKIQLVQIPIKFQTFLYEKAIKFYKKYEIRDIPFTIGRDAENHIETIAICYPHFDKFKLKIGVDIVTGRIKRMRGDLKYETFKEKKDKNGKVIFDEEGFPIIQHRIKFYKPYDLDAKILDKNGNETDKLKYPYIYKFDSYHQKSCKTCLYEHNSKTDNTCGTCIPNSETHSRWKPKEKSPS